MEGKRRILRYEVIRTLASGACSTVKLATDLDTGQEVAVKLLNLSALKHYTGEVRTLSRVPFHSGIISMGSCYERISYESRKGKRKMKSVIELEFCPYGDLFGCVERKGPMPESVAKWCVKQIGEALTHLHGCGVAHLDLKPENILIDSHHRLRLCDFGFSLETQHGYVTSSKGTRAYKAPEAFGSSPYIAAKADLFSLAVTVFVLVTGRHPFSHADPIDSFFHFIALGEWKRFWALHAVRGAMNISTDFVQLIESTMCLDPLTRLSLPEFLTHNWTTRNVASDSEAEAWLLC